MALPPHAAAADAAALWPRSQWAEIDAFLVRQPLTLRTSHHQVFDVHGGRIGMWWPGYGGHIEVAHE